MSDNGSATRDFVVDANRINDPNTDFTTKISIATGLRDNVDSYTASDLAGFTSSALPAIINSIRTIPPAFMSNDPQQPLRHLFLEILHRMPPHENVRPSVPEIMDVMVELIRLDNEENAVVAIKVAVDVYRTYKDKDKDSVSEYNAALEQRAQRFVDTIHDMYMNMEDLVRDTFSPTAEAAASPMMSTQDAKDSKPHPLTAGMRSLRVMAECPIATIIFGHSNVKLLGPVVKFLQLEAAPQQRAREEAATKGEPVFGMSSYIKNKQAYVAFITAQVKAMSLLAFVIRMPGPGDMMRQYQTIFPKVCLRLLEDIPHEAPGIRKEMVVALRHIVTTDYRTLFLPDLDRLLDERMLVGTSLTGQEQLRPFAYSAIADFVHSLRAQLSSNQLVRVIRIYARHLHDPTLTPGIQNMCTKVLVALHENLITKLTPEESGSVFTDLLESYVSKLHAVHSMFQDLISMLKHNAKEKEREKEKEKEKGDEKGATEPSSETPYTLPEVGNIEKQKPIQRASYVVETNEETMKESRLLFRTLLHGIRGAILSLRKVEGPVPDSEVLGRFAEGAFKCLSLWPSLTETREEKEVVDWFAGVFHEFQPHVFQEVWTLKMEFFINTCLEHPFAVQVANSLMGEADLSRQLTSIMLKHLVDRLDALGDQDAKSANVTLRLFKMVFMSVNLLPDANEAVLAPHLTRLIMDSFPLAAKAREPTSYYLLIRALFRSISGGKFDRVYNEILPLLQELLENLNRLINHTEGTTRDLLVELCLTVPVRLTHLLPYLQHLMRPLVLALRGSSEMAAQGLRTLELCIDNLTQDFLEPCFAPVRRDLMGALYDLLKPLPASHLLAHACIRILGKLGGRNRRLQYEYPLLEYQPWSQEASILLSFDGRAQHIDLAPMVSLATKAIRNTTSAYRKASLDVLKYASGVFLQDGAQGREREAVFTSTIEGLFAAIQTPDVQEEAVQFVRDLSRHIFMAELLNREPGPANSRRYPMSPLATIFVEWLPKSLAWNDKEEMKVAEGVVRGIVDDLANIGKADVAMDGKNPNMREPAGILHNLASAFVAVCHDEAWRKKMAGCKGITIMVSTDSLPPRMTLEREFDFVRALISVLKDMPTDPPRDVDEVSTALTDVIKKADSTPNVEEGVSPHRARMPFLTGILHMELASSNALVRKATQKCIQLLSELSGDSPTQLLLQHRERLLVPIYTKPLRALSFATQIGHIDAVTYCLGLEPPLPEANDELMRLLSEALALADAEDQNLLGRAVHRQNSLALNQLRVACIKLLTASMPLTDFFVRQSAVRQRAIGVYFKSLYSTSVDVKNAAHDGLRIVLQHQQRLPKELLQTGLRPILMNLADPKRISVAGLDGLARLLELLTHYFKVEIGVKLLEHYNSIADANMLHEAANTPLTTNEEIAKLAKLVNIFHLLPPAANQYLESLSNLVVETEAQLHAAAPTPFTEPFGKYVDRFADEAVDYFMKHRESIRHVQTLRHVIMAGVAPNFRDALMTRIPQVLQEEFGDTARPIELPLLLICHDVVKAVPSWLENHPQVLQVFLTSWQNEIQKATTDNGSSISGTGVQIPSILLNVLMAYLQHSMQVDVLFEVARIYAAPIPLEVRHLSHFFYQHVIAVESIALKHEVLSKFLDVLGSPTVSWARVTPLLSVIINPMLLVALARKDFNQGLVDAEIIGKLNNLLWRPIGDAQIQKLPGSDDVVEVQLLQLSSSLLQLGQDSLVESKKWLVKYGFHYQNADDMFLRQMAYLLIARFFHAFEAPLKLTLTLWRNLLRPIKETERNVEDRHLTRIALDVFAPMVKERITNDSWMKATKGILNEDGQSLSSLVHIYQSVVNHSDVFYDCRDFMVPHMTSSLQKIGLNNAPGSDTRTLSLDIIDVILSWERRRQAESDAMDMSDDGKTVSAWVTPLALRENIVSYVLRFIHSTPSEKAGHKGDLVTRALDILDYLLGPRGWPEVTVKISYFGKVFAQLEFEDTSSSGVLNIVKSLVIVLKDKDDEYFSNNASVIQSLLERPMASSDPILHETLQPILNRLLAAIPPPAEDSNADATGRSLYTWIDNTISEGLKNHTNLSGSLSVLQSFVTVQPQKLEAYGAAVMKTLAKLVKDYTSNPPVAGSEATIPLMKTSIDICRSNVGYLGENRQALLKAFVQLVDKATSQPLCKYLLEVAKEWTLEKKEAMYPTLKEKASILQRMHVFASRDDTLWHDFLTCIFQVYSDPALRRSDLTIRLEPLYLQGCRAKDPALRMRFIDLYDESLPKSLSSRLQFVLGSSSWDALGEQYWIPQAIDLLLGAVHGNAPMLPNLGSNGGPPTDFSQQLGEAKLQDLLRPVRVLLHLNSHSAHLLWVSIFKAIWTTLSRKEQQDVTRSMIALLSKDFHIRQIDARVNVIQSFLAGIHACSPPLSLPPYLVKYLGKTYNAWHIALEILQSSLESYREEESARDGTFDALAELYAELSEDDMFYGLWRRRSMFPDTNVAISFEQAGMYAVAQQQYEIAQVKARSGAMPFNEAEYCVWEDHWILAAQKLQQWDTLLELARAEENQDLFLECAWRTTDWSSEKDAIERALTSVADVATPRRRVFEAYSALLRSHTAVLERLAAAGVDPSTISQADRAAAGAQDRAEFIKLSEEAMQLSLRKWTSLPFIVSMAHIPLLQHFQQFVELHEASAIFTALQGTTATNLEKRSAELKGVLQAWRERLPNLWDDISIWSDLVAWRQHVFTAINNRYLPLIPQPGQNGQNPQQAGTNTTYGYRGYHETAWIINRFAHVARKHQLPDVCHTSLAKIYTLPNIEISEAFLKLREQARCHYQNPNELHAGLEVINNTNLMYFSNSQKAEFYTLKGMFIAKLGHNEEANAAFGLAVQTDLSLPKAWAEWGRYNDKLFRDIPGDMSMAANAVSCYLQAAGLYKSAKTRPLIIRILWLLSSDDQMATVARAFEAYKGDMALWYWITVIPQLLQAMTYRETPHARNMLINLAKNYPQALFFHLRTLREELAPARKKYLAGLEAAKAAEGATANGQTSPQGALENSQNGNAAKPNPATAAQRTGPKQPWDNVDEVVAILKTAFPLLALTLETMVDQFASRFKATQEEELVRYLNALLMEALQVHSLSVTAATESSVPVPPQCHENVCRFAESALHPDTRAIFTKDVIEPKPNLREYIRKLQVWRDKYERVLEARPRLQPLDVLSHWLVEFQHSKFDEVEVPGQYLEHKDSNANFVRISRFASQYELCLGMGYSYRRITISGHDGTKHSFIVQLPASRNGRREERLHQLFRIFNSVLVRRKETRKRVLQFYLPVAVPLNPQLRLVENDSSVVGLQDIYDQHLKEMGLTKEDPVILHAEKFRSLLDLHNRGNPNKQEYMNLRLELFDVVSTKMVPPTILSSYLSRSMANANALWLLRKQFTIQMAATTFMSYVMNCITRTPSRYQISRNTGRIYMSDFVPGYRTITRENPGPISLGSNEAVPFRFTPNFQTFVTNIGIEGLMTSGIMSIGRTLTEPEFDLEQHLGLFIRDEVIAYHLMSQKSIPSEAALRQLVASIVEQIAKKAEILSCRAEREQGTATPPGQSYNTTAVQSVVTLISNASNPQFLSRMAEQWLPWL